jgi:hypothetical protein
MSGKKENTLYRKISASMECKAEIFCPALVCVLVLASFSPLLLAGVPETGDIDFHISRINELASALQERNFPLLFNFNAFSGCGHAAGLFFPYILLLPAAVMVNLSIPVMTAYKIFAVITGLFAALSAYHAVRKISNDPFAAFAGGILYALCSYFACNYFTRSAVDEWLAMAFLPWIVLGMWQVVYAGKPTWGSLTLGLAGVIAAHPVTAFTAMIFCMAIFLCNAVRLFRRPRRIFIACATLLLAAGMNIYYIAPAFEQVLLMDFSFMVPEGAAADNCVPLTRLVLETPYNQPGNWIPAGTGMIFAVVMFLRAFILTSTQAYIYNGEAINFFAPVVRQYGINLKRNGVFGLVGVQRFWTYSYLRPISFELGRLAFEIMDYNYGYDVWLDPKTGKSYPVALPDERFDENGLPDSEGSFCTTLSYDGETLTGYTYKNDGTLDFEIKTFKGYKCVLKGGDKVVAVHMPGNAKLNEEAVSASLNGAKKFFDTYFKNLNYKAFVSSSWLLDTGLRKILNEDSNIVKLQNRFRIALAFKNDFSLFDNIFEVPKCPIEELIPKNRFQKEILEMIKGGRSLYSGRGYILK